MLEFVDIFAQDLTTTVFFAGSIAALIMFTAAVLWMNRVPAAISKNVPSYGL